MGKIDPIFDLVFPQKDVRRFKERFKKGKKDECWIYLDGSGNPLSKDKYGTFRLLGKNYRANRIAFCLRNKMDPACLKPEIYICHTCDNPPCVNPRHLYAGDAAINRQDTVKKFRGPNQHRFSISEIENIRRRYIEGKSMKYIADKCKVGESTIHKILHRKGIHKSYPIDGRTKKKIKNIIAKRRGKLPSLSDKQAMVIRLKRKQYRYKYDKLAEDYEVSVSTIRSVCRYKERYENTIYSNR